jgi:hypothetical protein
VCGRYEILRDTPADDHDTPIARPNLILSARARRT